MRNQSLVLKRAMFSSLSVAGIATTIVQLLIDASISNGLASCIVPTSALIAVLYINWSQVLDNQPPSTSSRPRL
jgi:uncharacterized membrane protein